MGINKSYAVRSILGLLSILGGLAVARLSLTFSGTLSALGDERWISFAAAVLVAGSFFVAFSVVLSGVRRKPAEQTVNVEALTDWFDDYERHEASQREARARDAQAGISPLPPVATATSMPSSDRRGVLVRERNPRTAG